MERRRTAVLMALAMVLMADPYGRHWGYDLVKRAGLRSGVVYPALSRFLEDGWLTDGWEEQWDGAKKRPPRRYYELTELGLEQLGALRDAAVTDPRWAEGLNPGLA